MEQKKYSGLLIENFSWNDFPCRHKEDMLWKLAMGGRSWKPVQALYTSNFYLKTLNKTVRRHRIAVKFSGSEKCHGKSYCQMTKRDMILGRRLVWLMQVPAKKQHQLLLYLHVIRKISVHMGHDCFFLKPWVKISKGYVSETNSRMIHITGRMNICFLFHIYIPVLKKCGTIINLKLTRLSKDSSPNIYFAQIWWITTWLEIGSSDLQNNFFPPQYVLWRWRKRACAKCFSYCCYIVVDDARNYHSVVYIGYNIDEPLTLPTGYGFHLEESFWKEHWK